MDEVPRGHAIELPRRGGAHRSSRTISSGIPSCWSCSADIVESRNNLLNDASQASCRDIDAYVEWDTIESAHVPNGILSRGRTNGRLNS